MEGKAIHELPKGTLRFIFLCVTGWSLEYIDALPDPVFRELSPMMQMKFRYDTDRPRL